MMVSSTAQCSIQKSGRAGQSYTFCTDNRLRISVWDERISELTGRPPLTAMGKKYFEVLPRIILEDRDALSTAVRRNKALTFKRYSFKCLHGQIDADVSVEPVRDVHGKVRSLMVSFFPYSTCHMAIKLQSLQRIIDIGKTASTLAHGVRNPLNAIKGAVVHLREKYAGEQTLIEFTRIMEDEISRLDNFISRFLSASVPDAEPTGSDINALLKRIEVFTSMQTYAGNIDTVYEYGDIPPVSIDSFQFEQAVLNVINNAIEAMSPGGRLTIRTSYEKRFDTDFVLVEITDTGPGISDNREAGPSGDRGRGFGLFITREIIQFYKGHMEIKSKKDAGTVVRLYFPAQERDRTRNTEYRP
ncbi:MAG: PAS domain-containing protein [Nitrospirales bacterium]|nr:PAS domain-containing protein [Nitrospirales bacterium]